MNYVPRLPPMGISDRIEGANCLTWGSAHVGRLVGQGLEVVGKLAWVGLQLVVGGSSGIGKGWGAGFEDWLVGNLC